MFFCGRPSGHPFVDGQHFDAGIRSKAQWTVMGMSKATMVYFIQI